MFGLEFNFSNINWKFASNCKWCTIGYFTMFLGMTIGYTVGQIYPENSWVGLVIGISIWGTILVLHITGILDDEEQVDKAFVFTKSSLAKAKYDV